MRTRFLVSAIALGLVVSVATPASATFPFPNPPPLEVYDYKKHLFINNGSCEGALTNGRPAGSDLPTHFHCEGDWKFTDRRDTSDPAVRDNPQELYGIRGTGMNRAWEVSTGRPDVVIAVMDSGIMWEHQQPGLTRKYYLNRRELPLPQGGPNVADTRFGGYDVNGDGGFNALDYVGHPGVSDLNGNTVIDPEDLIRIFSDGFDGFGANNEQNGYVDDISGWDFFENDNNPQDDSDYGHGTGEAKDSTHEADIPGDDGMCPNCMMMPMRVGDSFVADVNHWAEAVVYATDNGVSVVQEALGTLNHSSFGQAAADYAYRNGVIINASEADEAAGHHNWPAAYDHTMVVNSVRNRSLPSTTPNSYLYFNGCTNYGSYTFVSIPSTSCSSEATGRSAGVSGLLYSAALNAIESGHMTRYIRDDNTVAPFPLSAEEAMQLWRLAGDDIDFSTPCAGAAPGPPAHEFCDDGAAVGVTTPSAPPNNYGTTIPDSRRYQSARGWDYFFGYGRLNAARLLRFVGRDGAREYLPTGPFGVGDSLLSAQDRIPPEADIAWPPRWRQYGYDQDQDLLLPDDPSAPDQIVVRGRVAANRVTALAGGTFDWKLEWAPEVQGPLGTGGVLAAPGSQEKSDGPWTVAAQGAGRTSAMEGELGRIDIDDVVAAHQLQPPPFDPLTDPTSEFLPEQYAVRIRVRVISHPANHPGTAVDESVIDTVNNEAVLQKQIDVYPATESLIRYDLGVNGRRAGGAGAPSFHDVDGDGRDELLLPTEDGVIHAYTDAQQGTELPGWPVHTERYPGIRDTGTNGYSKGLVPKDVYGSILLGTVAAADLDDDGDLEVMAADMEGKLYAWEPDGSIRPGFPVSVDRSLSKEPPCGPATIPACDDYAPGPSTPGGIRDEHNDRDWGINSTPAIGDLDPAYPGLEIVSGSNDAHIYAWHEDGTLVEGWPVVLRDPAKVATMDPSTRHWTYTNDARAEQGTKVVVTPSLGDLDQDGDLEVVVGVNEQYVEPVNASAATSPLTEVIQKQDEYANQLNDQCQATAEEIFDEDCPGELPGGLITPGNTRIYALHSDGSDHPQTPETSSTPHVHDQAYVSGWPVPIAMVETGLLPYVGEGTNSQAVIANFDAALDPKLEVAIASIAGPGYVLEHDGKSFYGNDPQGRHITLQHSPPSGGSGSDDTPAYMAVGALAAGSLDLGVHLSIVGPTAGLKRLIDIALEEQQLGAEDQLGMWNGPTGAYEANKPIVVNDLQFFTEPVIADVTGEGAAEVIQSTAMSDLVVAGIDDNSATAERHFTGGWGVTAAGVGDPPLGTDDGRLHIAQVTREGFLRLYQTDVAANGQANGADCTALSQWPEYGHDARNSGNYHTDGERPYPVKNLQAVPASDGSVTLSFTATGDDRTCGGAQGYRVRIIDGSAADPEWEDGVSEITVPTDKQAGEPDSINLPPLPPGTYTLMVRADDDAGNGSAISSVIVTISSSSVPPQGGQGGPGGPNGQLPQGEGTLPPGSGVPVPVLCPGLEDVTGNHVVGTPGADRIVGTPGRDIICGLGGDDELSGRGGNDLIVGAGGDDRIRGGREIDALRGGAGSDNLSGGPQDDRLRGGSQRDRCRGGGGQNELHSCEY